MFLENMDSMVKYGVWLRKERCLRGLTIKDLADISGYTRSCISSLENGKYNYALRIIRIKEDIKTALEKKEKILPSIVSSPGFPKWVRSQMALYRLSASYLSREAGVSREVTMYRLCNRSGKWVGISARIKIYTFLRDFSTFVSSTSMKLHNYDFSSWINKEIQEKGSSINEISCISGVPNDIISYCLRGNSYRKPSLLHLYAIKSALCCLKQD